MADRPKLGERVTLHWRALVSLLSAVLAIGVAVGATKSTQAADGVAAINAKLDQALANDARQDRELTEHGVRLAMLEHPPDR